MKCRINNTRTPNVTGGRSTAESSAQEGIEVEREGGGGDEGEGYKCYAEYCICHVHSRLYNTLGQRIDWVS